MLKRRCVKLNSDLSGKKKLGYKWIVVAMSFVMVMVCLGFCSSPKSLFIGPVTKHLGISRGAFSIGDSLRFIATAVINLFFGALVERYGTKKLILAGFTCLIASQLLYAYAEAVYAFYIGGILLGLGFSWTTTTMVGCVVNKWCRENKGTIMGAVLAANGIGGAIAIQLITPVIESGALGYKKAYIMVAAILFAVSLLFVFFYKEKKKEDDEPKYSHKKKSRGREWVGIEYKDAMKMPYFYTAAACIFLTGLVLQGANGISAAHMKDVGLDPQYVATVLSIHSLTLAGFKFLTGVIYDRFGLRTTITACSITAVIVMIFLSLLTDSFMGMVFAMLYGIFSSFALPLETILLPIYAGDLFGQKSFDRILGIFVSVNTAGYAVGAPMMNFIYDVTGSYAAGCVLCAGIMIVVIVGLQFVISAAHKKQKEIEQLAEEK